VGSSTLRTAASKRREESISRLGRKCRILWTRLRPPLTVKFRSNPTYQNDAACPSCFTDHRATSVLDKSAPD
jgi:hypothetical protein